MKVIDWLVDSGVIESKAKAKRLFKAGAVDLLDSNAKFKKKLKPDDPIADHAYGENMNTKNIHFQLLEEIS